MSKVLFLVAIILLAFGPAAAQTEADLKGYFEGRHVTLKIDMPATKDGVNIYPERAQALNYSEYAARLKRNGTAIRRGDSIMITKIKVKDKHVEFQLGGGGYGTIGDETDTAVNVPSASKSRREKHLEDELKRETDTARRKKLKEELDDLRRNREREDRINRSIAAAAEEAKRARIEQKALQGGSRFNVHFSLLDANVLTPAAIIEALSKYVDFSESAREDEPAPFLRPAAYSYVAAGDRAAQVVHLAPPTTYLSAGLSTREVIRLLGQPIAIATHGGETPAVTTYEFARGNGHVLIAQFVSDVLVSSRIESRGQVVQAGEGK
jgi:hypothetical protein